ncbi:uncharacterized protein TNCV_4057781 [Trichonephila clavipes]|nr:uncharacterized protein TNCV_4057781 [Trichonephila clavipes]
MSFAKEEANTTELFGVFKRDPLHCPEKGRFFPYTSNFSWNFRPMSLFKDKKSIIDADSDNENEKKNAAPVSSVIRNEEYHENCQVIYCQFGLAIHQNDHQARRRFVEWAQNEIAVVPDFHKRILFSDEAHFWLNGYVNKQNCRIWSEANPQVYVERPLHPEQLTVWCAL